MSHGWTICINPLNSESQQRSNESLDDFALDLVLMVAGVKPQVKEGQ